MGLRKRLLHLLFAVRDSFSSLALGLLLLFIVVIGLRAVPTLNEVQEISFLLGIIASIIATLILKVSERYSSSCSAVSTILGEVERIATYIETVVVSDPLPDIHKFQLWQMYMDICQKSESLSYKKGFSDVSIAVSNAVEVVYHGGDNESLIMAVKKLRELAL